MMSLLFNTLSVFVTTFLPRSKHLLISWLQSPSTLILEPKKMKSDSVSMIGLDAMIFVFWMLNFKPAFSLSSLKFIKRLLGSSSLSAIKVVSPAYLRLLIFLLAILIPVCQSSSPALCMMYSAYKLNKQGDDMQPWCTPFQILNQFIAPCWVLTVASCPAYRFLMGQVIWSGILISLRILHSLLWSIVKGFNVVNKAEVDVFFEFFFFSCNPAYVGNLISGSSSFSKPNLYIWKFSVHVLLKASLKDFEHCFASMWNECNCMAIWTFLALLFFVIWMKTDLFQSCVHCWIFQIYWHIECSTLTASSFRILK